MSSETTNTESKASNANESTETEEASVSGASSTFLEPPAQSSSTKMDGDASQDDEDSEASEAEEIYVETIFVDAYPIGSRVIDQPLSEPVVAALQANGLNYLTRYQQALLDYVTLGDDWWVAANLSSSRGMTMGAYLVDVALGIPEQLSVIVCVAVPKVREFFTRDLLSVAQFTDLKILMLDTALDAETALMDTPNILVAPVDVVFGLRERLDMQHVQVLYLDEMEKSLRDCEDVVQQLCLHFESVQRIVQTSYFSATLNPQVEAAIPGLVPHRFRKTFNKREWSIYHSELTWNEVSPLLLANSLLARYLVVVSPAEMDEMVAHCLKVGFDVEQVTTETDTNVASKMFDRLKDNRIQMLFTTKEVLESHNTDHFETDFLVVKGDVAAADWDILNGFRKKVRSLLLLEYSEAEWQGQEIASIQELCPYDQSLADSILQAVRAQSMELSQEIWSDAADSLLNSPDCKELVGMLIQTFLQRSRGEVGYIHSSIYKMESRDLFQRRKKGSRQRRHGKRRA